MFSTSERIVLCTSLRRSRTYDLQSTSATVVMLFMERQCPSARSSSSWYKESSRKTLDASKISSRRCRTRSHRRCVVPACPCAPWDFEESYRQDTSISVLRHWLIVVRCSCRTLHHHPRLDHAIDRLLLVTGNDSISDCFSWHLHVGVFVFLLRDYWYSSDEWKLMFVDSLDYFRHVIGTLIK